MATLKFATDRVIQGKCRDMMEIGGEEEQAEKVRVS
jgi:hypothetical protein